MLLRWRVIFVGIPPTAHNLAAPLLVRGSGDAHSDKGKNRVDLIDDYFDAFLRSHCRGRDRRHRTYELCDLPQRSHKSNVSQQGNGHTRSVNAEENQTRLAIYLGIPCRQTPPPSERLLDAEVDIQARLGDEPLDFDSMQAISNIYRAAAAVRRRAEREVLAEAGLSWGGFTILWVLWVWGEMEAAQLASECDLAKGTLTGMVTTLEKQGRGGANPHAVGPPPSDRGSHPGRTSDN